MKKSSLQLRADIAKLQDQLRQAETREAERIGRIALKAGLGEVEIEEADLLTAFETVAKRFRGGKGGATAVANGAGTAAGRTGEA